MKVKNASFVISAVGKDQWPYDDIPEVAFSGKSNVGKSSLINALTNRKKLAYSASAPGKTRMINFYDINGKIRLVDLPGYGFSTASKKQVKVYGSLAEKYFRDRKNIKLVVQILDIRHDPTEDDLQMIDFLNKSGLPYIISVSKCDKLSKSQYMLQAAKIANMLNIHPDTPFILTSSTKRIGTEEIWDAISFYCFEEQEDTTSDV